MLLIDHSFFLFCTISPEALISSSMSICSNRDASVMSLIFSLQILSMSIGSLLNAPEHRNTLASTRFQLVFVSHNPIVIRVIHIIDIIDIGLILGLPRFGLSFFGFLPLFGLSVWIIGSLGSFLRYAFITPFVLKFVSGSHEFSLSSNDRHLTR